jgi:hypothetical protein
MGEWLSFELSVILLSVKAFAIFIAQRLVNSPFLEDFYVSLTANIPRKNLSGFLFH